MKVLVFLSLLSIVFFQGFSQDCQKEIKPLYLITISIVRDNGEPQFANIAIAKLENLIVDNSSIHSLLCSIYKYGIYYNYSELVYYNYDDLCDAVQLRQEDKKINKAMRKNAFKEIFLLDTMHEINVTVQKARVEGVYQPFSVKYPNGSTISYKMNPECHLGKHIIIVNKIDQVFKLSKAEKDIVCKAFSKP